MYEPGSGRLLLRLRHSYVDYTKLRIRYWLQLALTEAETRSTFSCSQTGIRIAGCAKCRCYKKVVAFGNRKLTNARDVGRNRKSKMDKGKMENGNVRTKYSLRLIILQLPTVASSLVMQHIKPTSKGDPLCPLGFHPQVRWPTRCKRCFR